MKNVKLKFFVVLIVLVVVASFCVSCADNKEQFKLIDDEYVYNESDFATEMAKTKDNNVEFAKSGNLNFNVIVYPSQIDDLQLDKDGGVVRKDRHKVELKNSAKFMAEALCKMTGHENVEVVASGTAYSGKAIVLKWDTSIADETQGQGYKLNIGANEIVIASSTLQGLSNGIFSFLEDKLGCMFVATDYDYIPTLKDINLAGGESLDIPDIKWRYVYGYEAERHQKGIMGESSLKEDYFDWHTKVRLNGAGCDDWFNWCHTSFVYISPEKYFKDHPEYFSLYHGRRCYEQGPVSGQLCYTNEDVYRIISEQVLQEMAENPDLHVWDVSQMDTWINRGVGCQCKNCKAIDDREGTPMGSILAFVNRLAKEVKEKYPDNYISTLSYNYSVKPPKNMVPEDNVIIKLCLMPGDSASSLMNPTSKVAKTDKKIVEDWSKIAKNIVLWEYDVNFSNYTMPHPALAYVEENHKFLKENNTYGIFHQMAHSKGGIDAELSSYVYAKSMWDVEVDCSKLMAKYMQVYYGKAASKMTEYYNTMYQDVLSSGRTMYIYDSPTTVATKYFSHSRVSNYLKLLEEAKTLESGNAEIANRIDKSKLGHLYLRASAFGLNTKERRAALDEYKNICDKNGITIFREAGYNDVETFYKKTNSRITGDVWIVVGSVLGGVLLICGIVGLIVWLKKKKLKKKEVGK